jgi:hypothetical protein
VPDDDEKPFVSPFFEGCSSKSLEKVEKSKLVTSKSAEKIVHEKSGHQQQHVRTSKSQELKSDDEFAIRVSF